MFLDEILSDFSDEGFVELWELKLVVFLKSLEIADVKKPGLSWPKSF